MEYKYHISGVVTDSPHIYKCKACVFPVAHHYEEAGEEPYIKYSCPVCDSLNNKHQVHPWQQNCPLCNVNLFWESNQVNNNELQYNILCK